MKVHVNYPIYFDLEEIEGIDIERIRSGDEEYIDEVRSQILDRADYHMGTGSSRPSIQECEDLPQVEDDYAISCAKLMEGDGKNLYELFATWEVGGYAKVRADSVEEACDILQGSQENLPKISSYIHGSFEVDRELAEGDYPEEEPA